MLRKFTVLVFMLTGMTRFVSADEGMWLPMFVDRLNYVDMQKMGLHLTPDEIYSINHSSLKDAIVQFGGGCTAEVISSEGLLLTNHHCGYGQIQAHSSVKNDYLTNGFTAMSREEELPNAGLQVTFLVRMEDVSQRIMKELTDNMTEMERALKIKDISTAIEAEATANTHYTAVVKDFFNGNEFYLFIYENYKDVRLVFAPPSSIGFFGGDTDNWMWPRHTGDFSIFRIYSGPDGKPADYSKNNIALKPKSFLPISLNGVKKDDYCMIMGYPGRTDRYLTSYGVKLAIEQTNPSIVKIRDKKLSIIRADMLVSDELRIMYASKYNTVSNYWKYYIGQTRGLKRLEIADKKQLLENEFQKWANADPARKEKYGSVVSKLSLSFEELKKYNYFKQYYNEVIIRGTDLMNLCFKFQNLYKALDPEKGNKENAAKQASNLKSLVTTFFQDFNPPTDKKVFAALFKMFRDDIPAEQHPESLRNADKKYSGDFSKFAEELYSKSMFSNKDKLLAYLDAASYSTLNEDPAFKFAISFQEKFNEINKLIAGANENLSKCNRMLVAGLREMYPKKSFYPNANSTMRLTYGKVLDYYPADAVHYDYFTTLKGVIDKEDPNNEEFIVPAKLKELYKKKDFGRYGENGTLKTCFLSNNDITGGNSGSPVLNANGQLIGIAFDANWEAMSGDIAFEPDLQRCINVDIRYVLFVIDKFSGASHLVKEMTLVQDKNASDNNPNNNKNN